jgi:hypothetical protein
MHQPEHARGAALLEEALTVLFCLVDDIYQNVNPNGRRYESLKKLSDSEVITLALFQQLRGLESQRSFLRDASRFFSHLFPGVVGLAPSSLHRRIRKLRCFLEPLRRAVLSELVGEPETLLIDSTLLAVLHPRQVGQSAGFVGAAWVRWDSFCVYGVKLHLLCATNRVPISYELTPANTAEVCLVGELLNEAQLGDGFARRLFGDLAYRSEALGRLSPGGSSVGDRTLHTGWQAAAGGSLLRELEAGLRARRNLGDHAGGAGRKDRGEDYCLHLRFPGQPTPGPSSRED